MQVQINTDDNVEGQEDVARRLETEVGRILGRFSDQITRIEVHLSDENADKSGGADKRCLMEARLTGRKPEAVTHQAATVDEAFSGAAQKMRRALESSLGRLVDNKGGASIRKDGAF